MEKEENFTARSQMLRCYDAQTRPYAFRAENPEDFSAWKKRAREKLSDLLGLSFMEPCRPSFRVTGKTQEPGFRRIRAVLQTEPEIFMPFYLLVPSGLRKGEKRPCVLAPHGHGAGGKESVAGVCENPLIAEKVRAGNAYGADLARLGYVIFCPDARGSGERREPHQQGDAPEKIFSCSCDALSFAAMSLGGSLAGMWTWDLMRLIDLIQTLPFCDGGRIACCGFSGGGLQTLYLTAMDDRVRCAVISGYFHSFRDCILTTNLCGCNFVPGLWRNMDLCDIAALAAPRPLLIEGGRDDPLNGQRGLKGADEQFRTLEKAYRLSGKEDRLRRFVFAGGHAWNGAQTGTFLKQFL